MENVIQNQGWCVSHGNFVHSAQIAQEHDFQEHVNVLLLADGNGVSAEVVIMGPRSITALLAQSIRIQFRTFDILTNGHRQWRALHEVLAKFLIAEVNVPRVPVGTKMLSASATLDTSTEGLLYLATVGG